VGLSTNVRLLKFAAGGKGTRNDIEFAITPGVNYKFSERLAATFLAHVYRLNHSYAKGGWSITPVELQPGIRWDITKHLFINPFLNLMPSHLAWNTVNVGMVVHAAFN